MRFAHSFFVLPLLIAGCMSASDPGEPMTAHMTMVGDDLTKVGTEDGAHKTAVAAATKVGDLAALEAAHMTKVSAFIDDMKTMCVEMKDTCMNAAGMMADAQPMADLADQMTQECNNHKAAMAAADLPAATTEEARHQAALADLQDKVMTKHDALSPTAATYTCSAHMHGM